MNTNKTTRRSRIRVAAGVWLRDPHARSRAMIAAVFFVIGAAVAVSAL